MVAYIKHIMMYTQVYNHRVLQCTMNTTNLYILSIEYYVVLKAKLKSGNKNLIRLLQIYNAIELFIAVTL